MSLGWPLLPVNQKYPVVQQLLAAELTTLKAVLAQMVAQLPLIPLGVVLGLPQYLVSARMEVRGLRTKP